jgi:hypothetical protein
MMITRKGQSKRRLNHAAEASFFLGLQLHYIALAVLCKEHDTKAQKFKMHCRSASDTDGGWQLSLTLLLVLQ